MTLDPGPLAPLSHQEPLPPTLSAALQPAFTSSSIGKELYLAFDVRLKLQSHRLAVNLPKAKGLQDKARAKVLHAGTCGR